MVLKATAGLRLLPEDKAKALLNEVRRRFSPFATQTVWRKGAGWKNHRATAAYKCQVGGKKKRSRAPACLAAAEIREEEKKTAVVRFCGSDRIYCVKTQGLINRFSRDDVFDVSHLPELAD